MSATEQKEKSSFKGITETDETFYTHIQKGKRCTERKPRKRGGSNSRGISDKQAAVLTTMDRNGNSEYSFTNMGRISEKIIKDSIGERVTERMILCSDGHRSYKAFTNNIGIEHYTLNISKGERVKGEMHIQHINSLQSRIRHFFNYDRKGVATKYLQKFHIIQYLNKAVDVVRLRDVKTHKELINSGYALLKNRFNLTLKQHFKYKEILSIIGKFKK